MGKYIKLSKAQKEEIRRLTQLANRRIKAAERAYRKAGKTVLPKDVVGDYQIKEKWNTKTTPISRSIKFDSQKDYRRKLHELRRFEFGRPGIKEYTAVQQNKTAQAVETALGQPPTADLLRKLDNMTAPELANFWNLFSRKASRAGLKYSSNAVMIDTLQELYPEDIQALQETG